MRTSRTHIVWALLLALQAAAAPTEVFLLLDGLDATLLDSCDGNAELLAPRLREFCREALLLPDASSPMTDGRLGAAAFVQDAAANPLGLLSRASATAALATLQRVAPESLALALAAETSPILVHLTEDPARPIDPELLLRCDPAPWAGAEHATDLRQQRNNRLQRAQLWVRLRAANRPVRATPDADDSSWLARYRLAELEREIGPALDALRGHGGPLRVVLSAVHGPRDSDADLSPRARRIPFYVWPGANAAAGAPRPPSVRFAPGAAWTFSALPGEANFSLARSTDRQTLRCENGRWKLFDRSVDLNEQFDLASQAPAQLAAAQAQACAELLGTGAILHLEAKFEQPQRLRLFSLRADRLIEFVGGSASVQGGALVLEAPAGRSHLTVRLDCTGDPLRILTELNELRWVLGRSTWAQGPQLRLDLASGALLAALGGATPATVDAPRQPELHIWIERRDSAQRPASPE